MVMKNASLKYAYKLIPTDRLFQYCYSLIIGVGIQHNDLLESIS